MDSFNKWPESSDTEFDSIVNEFVRKNVIFFDLGTEPENGIYSFTIDGCHFAVFVDGQMAVISSSYERLSDYADELNMTAREISLSGYGGASAIRTLLHA